MKWIVLIFLLLPCFAFAATPQNGSASPNTTINSDAKAKIIPPKAIATPKPAPAADEGKGAAVFSVTIGTDGLVHDPQMTRSSGSKQADANALAAIKRWKFKPATKDGVPIPVIINIEVRSQAR
jgi:TonB family protein